jgi:hypothetical protein
MMPEELRKGITSNPELGFEHGNSRWKSLDEQKVMDISRRGFKMMEEREILMPHPLKRYLRGWVCYNGNSTFLSGRPKIPHDQQSGWSTTLGHRPKEMTD